MALFFSYILTALAFAIIDFVWLGIIMKDSYRAGIGHLMAPAFNIPAAIVFYLLYTLGIFFFAIYPSYLKESLGTAAMVGAFFGLIAYATYDLSNLATLKSWPLSLTLIDMAWGFVLSGSVSAIGYYCLRLFHA